MHLKTYIVKNGLQRKFVAEKLGITYSHLHRILKGDVKPSKTLMLLICTVTKGEVDLEDWE